ncbi:MAG: cobalamin-dependent protein [Paraclostridium sordellii]
MPYLAAFVDESKYEITLIDEYNQKILFKKFYDLVVITVNTSNAPHCYNIAKIFKDKGSTIVFGGPHTTLLPDEVKEHCDVVIIGEAEES